MSINQDLALFMLSMSEYVMDELDQERFNRIVKANEKEFMQQVEVLRGQQLNHLASCLKEMIDEVVNHAQ